MEVVSGPEAQRLFERLLGKLTGQKDEPCPSGLTHKRGPYTAKILLTSEAGVVDRDDVTVCSVPVGQKGQRSALDTAERIAKALNACCGVTTDSLHPHLLAVAMQHTQKTVHPVMFDAWMSAISKPKTLDVWRDDPDQPDH